MKFSKYVFKAVTPVIALFQKQHSCSSNRATTICGKPAESLRQVPIRHNRIGVSTEIKARFVPPTMCRLTNVSHGTGLDPRYMSAGKEKMDAFVHFLRSDYASEHPFVMHARTTCMLLRDYYDHGFEFKVSNVELSGDELFHIVDDKTIEVDGTRCHRSPDLYDADEMEFL